MRVFDLRRDREPLLTIRPLVDVPVLGHHGVFAVGNAVLPQISGAEVLRHDLQRSAGRANRRRVRGALCRSELQRHIRARHQPLRLRDALPGTRRVGRRWCGTKSQDSSLRAGIGIHLERVVVLPRDVNTARHAHQRGRTVGLALLTGGFIFRRIPGVRNLCRLRGDRNALVVAFPRRHHAPAPVLSHDRDPVPSQIDRRSCFRRARRLRIAALSLDMDETAHHECRGDGQEDAPHFVFPFFAASSLYTTSTNMSVVQGPDSAPY